VAVGLAPFFLQEELFLQRKTKNGPGLLFVDIYIFDFVAQSRNRYICLYIMYLYHV